MIKIGKSSINNRWKSLLSSRFSAEYGLKISEFISAQKKLGKKIYPPENLIFRSFDMLGPAEVKVLILGQDPYHNPGQANGLSFSVNEGIKLPPSLRNIYKELEADLGIKMTQNGDLSSWSKQGVLMINAILTVNENEAGSHKKAGWEKFSDAIIEGLSEQNEHMVFILWGNFAAKKEVLIDTSKHLILKGVHPSPLSAYQGFWGCKHFSKCNEYLLTNRMEAINWQV